MIDENEDLWMSPKQVGQRLGVSESVVYSWIRENVLQAFDVSRKGETPRWRINKIAVEQFSRSRANFTVPANES
jgi:excisionase family DNA binding protein